MVNMELARKIVEYLNELNTLDCNALGVLVSCRVTCNKELAEHPSCQVVQVDDYYVVEMLGVFNGLCGVHEGGESEPCGPIGAKFSGEKVEFLLL